MSQSPKLEPSEAETHYERLLAHHYAWMLGDFDRAVAEQRELLHGLAPSPPQKGGPRRALDLGAGTGLHSVALAQLGAHVVAIDLSARMLTEMRGRAEAAQIEPVVGDIRQLALLPPVRRVAESAGGFDTVVCMGDTLTHLPSEDDVARLLADIRQVTIPGGCVVLTFRDLTRELTGAERFVLVRGDAERVMTCFLEYEPDIVRVHDVIHERTDDGWALRVSSYPKLRIAPGWVRERLVALGFTITHEGSAGRLVAFAARRT